MCVLGNIFHKLRRFPQVMVEYRRYNIEKAIRLKQKNSLISTGRENVKFLHFLKEHMQIRWRS